MATIFRDYMHSFQQLKHWMVTSIIDGAAWGIIITVFTIFGDYIQHRSMEIMQGKTPEQIQSLLATAPEQLLPFMSQLKWFILISLGTLAVLIPLALFLFSLSGALVWNYLLRKKLTTKTYWRWNALNLTLLLPLVVYGLLFIVVKFLTLLLFRSVVDSIPVFYVSHTTLVDGIVLVLNSLINVAGGVIALLLLFAVYYEFTSRYRVWTSIGEGLHLIRKNWPTLWKKVLFIIITISAVTALLIPVRQVLLFFPTISFIINLIIVLLLFSWLRLYLFSTLHGTQQISKE